MILSDAHVLVTGGSAGIGLAIARLLSQRGAQVAICGRQEKPLLAAAEEMGAVAIKADISDENDVVELIPAVIEELGGYDTLINNAGIGSSAQLVDLASADFRRVWETNVLGAMLVARESARHFVARSFGNIINIASTAAGRGYPGGTTYVASKFALAGMSECWRSELRKHNVRVIQINPSEVLTNFRSNAGIGAQPDNPTKLRSEDVAHVVAGALEMDDRGLVTETTIWATNPKD